MDSKSSEIDDKVHDGATNLGESSDLANGLFEGEHQGKNTQHVGVEEAGQNADIGLGSESSDDLRTGDDGDAASEGALEEYDVEVFLRGSGAMVIGDEVAIREFIDSLAVQESKTVEIGGSLGRTLGQQLKNSGILVQGAAGISESSGRFVLLTKETLEGIKKFGLVDTDVPGIKHAMLGTRGNVKKWAQFEVSSRSKFLNPAMLSGIGGIMTQLANQQSMAEITAYLRKLDHKLDVVIRKVDQTKRSDLGGFLKTLREATLRYEREGVVDPRFMNEIISFQNTVNTVESYAWDQIFGIVDDIPRKSSVKKVQAATDSAYSEISNWLGLLAEAYLAECRLDDFKLKEKLEESVEAYNQELEMLRVLRAARDRKRSGRINRLGKTAHDVARYAQKKRVMNQTRALDLHQQANDILALTYDFAEATQLLVNRRTIPVAELGMFAKFASNAIQTQRDELPRTALEIAINETPKAVKYLAREVDWKQVLKK